jgi:BlaI family transcriptional regulator, penicillinase repressor
MNFIFSICKEQLGCRMPLMNAKKSIKFNCNKPEINPSIPEKEITKNYFFIYEYNRIIVYENNRIMDNQKILKPTESELEILAVLWAQGSATVRAVHEELTKNKEAGYTTTLKLMQIMHEKGLVVRNTDSKTHIYTPAINKEKTQLQFVNKMINNLFAGSHADLVMQALGDNKTTEDELDKIEALIATLKAKK